MDITTDITTNIFDTDFTRGDTFVHRIAVKKTDGSVKDISGATAVYTVRSHDENGTILAQKTTGVGIQLTAPIDGILDVTLSPIETSLFMPRARYVYDCRLTIGIEVLTVQKGKLGIGADVSHA